MCNLIFFLLCLILSKLNNSSEPVLHSLSELLELLLLLLALAADFSPSEISKFLNGEQNIDVTKVQISIKTRQYAKRQRTWARNQMIDWENIDHKKLNSFIKNIKISSLKLDQ